MPRTSHGPLVPVEPTMGAHVLWRYRLLVGLTQAQAAEQLQVSGPTVHDWERGRKRPSKTHRAAIERWSRGTVRAELWARASELVREAEPAA